MPQALICIIAFLAGVATIIFLITTCTESDKLYWGLWLAVAACLLMSMLIWVNLDHNVPNVVIATIPLERREHTIFFVEEGKLVNATSKFGIDNIDPEKQVLIKSGPSTRWSYGRYMDLDSAEHTMYTIRDKMKP
jgi:hypothetical protein